MVTQLFDPAHDRLELAAGSAFSRLDFRPTFVQHMRGFQMVYLNPRLCLTSVPGVKCFRQSVDC